VAEDQVVVNSEPSLVGLALTLLAGAIGVHFIRSAKEAGRTAARWNEFMMSSNAENSNTNINSVAYFLGGIAIVLIAIYSLVNDFALPWFRRYF
jgi:hypothetical protein